MLTFIFLFFLPFPPFRCADGFMGQRCEFQDLDQSYLRKFCWSAWRVSIQVLFWFIMLIGVSLSLVCSIQRSSNGGNSEHCWRRYRSCASYSHCINIHFSLLQVHSPLRQFLFSHPDWFLRFQSWTLVDFFFCRRRSKIKPITMSGIKEENLQLKPFRSRASFSSSIRMSTTMYSSPKVLGPSFDLPNFVNKGHANLFLLFVSTHRVSSKASAIAGDAH